MEFILFLISLLHQLAKKQHFINAMSTEKYWYHRIGIANTFFAEVLLLVLRILFTSIVNIPVTDIHVLCDLSC